MSSAPTFSTLSPELHLLVGDHLSFADRLALASVSPQLRALFAPTQFSCLRFTNREANADAIRAVVDKYGYHVRKLYFECHLYPNIKECYTDDPDRPEIEETELPGWSRDLLSGKKLDKPKAMWLKFILHDEYRFYGSWGGYNDIGSIYIADDPEERDEITEREQEYAWRSVLREVWSLLSANESISRLEIEDLIPREASSWWTDEWKSFLAQLSTLSIALWGSDNGGGWKSNTCYGYLDFQRRLDDYFFDHASKLVHLKIRAYVETMYGCDGRRSTRVALFPRHMPALKTLELEECIVDPNVMKFLASHAACLQQLILRNCASALHCGMAEDHVSWADFFADFRSHEPSLVRLEVINSAVPLTFNQTCPPDLESRPLIGHKKETYMMWHRYIPPDDEEDNIKAIRRAVKEGERRLFRHIWFDDKHGTIYENHRGNVERFEAGEDQREYDALMSTVARNARASARH